MSREELFEAWRRFLERLAARYPLVLVLEDIQWADDGLLDFVDHVADWAQGPILVATTRASCSSGARPGAAASATPPRSTSTRCPQPRARTCSTISFPDPILPELKATIVERSEGNPLYVEEIVRKLIDDGVLRATAASQWEVAKAFGGIELPAPCRRSSPRAWMDCPMTRRPCSRMRRSSGASSGLARWST